MHKGVDTDLGERHIGEGGCKVVILREEVGRRREFGKRGVAPATQGCRSECSTGGWELTLEKRLWALT